MTAARITLAVAWLFTVGVTAPPTPQLVVERAQAMQYWTSAAAAPVYASADPTGRIDFWDAHDGTRVGTTLLSEPKAIAETQPTPTPIVLSNDGRVAAAVTNDRIALISTHLGTIQRLAGAPPGNARPVAFSPDGRTLAVDVRPAPDKNTLQVGHGSIALISIADAHTISIPGAETDAAYSPDGRFIATLAPARDRLLVYDARSRTLRMLSDGGGVYGPLAYSPDGTLIASLGDDPSIPPNGKGIFDPNGTDHDLVVKLWDVRRGRLAAQLPWQTVSNRFYLDEATPGAFAFGDVRTLAINASKQTVVYDTSSLAVIGRLVHDERENLWNAHQAATPYHVGHALGFLSEDATEIAFTHWAGPGYSDRTDATIPFPARLGSIAIDRAGRALAVDRSSSAQNGAAQRDAAYGLNLNTLHWTTVPAAQTNPQPLVFLSDGRLAIDSKCALLYVDLARGKSSRHRIPAGSCDQFFSDGDGVAISSDGQTLFLGNTSGSPGLPLQTYDVATGRRRSEIPDTMGLPLACASLLAQCVFPQRATIPNLGHQHDPLKLTMIDSGTGKVGSIFVLHSLDAGAAFVDSDKQLIIREVRYTNVERDFIDVIDPRNGTLERQFPCPEGDIAFAPSAPLFAITNGAATTIFNVTGSVVNTIPNTIAGHRDTLTFFPDGSKLAAIEPDGTIAVRATTSGLLLATLAFFPHHDTLDWLAYTPAGYYAGSAFSMSMIRWRVGDQTLPAAAFAERFHRPDVVAAAFR